MECLCTVFEIGKTLWEVTGGWVVCIIQINTNMQKLRQKMEELSNQEDDVKTELSTAEMMPGKRRRREVEGWLENVQIIRSDVQTLERKVAEERNSIYSCAWLGKGIVEKIQEVEELQQSGRFSKEFLVIDASPTRGLIIQTESLFGETTCVRSKDKVWEHLMNDEVRRIGVYGMGGAGKTTILHHINNELLQATDSFDNVIWVTVSEPFSIHKVQDEIAKVLQLDLSNDHDETIRATKLTAMLSPRKRYVLILDDLWESFPLHKVGIPKPTSCNGCKLVLTTRSLEVCRKMECKPVKVELLTEQEALDLFMSKAVDQETKLADEVKEIASEVAKQCERLPLAVITVAGSMRARDVDDIREWRNALNELNDSIKQISDGETHVFEVLKYSYSRLKDEKLQQCFLYCALYPEDADIPRKELIDCWISEGLIPEMSNREAMFDKGHNILNKLVNACLLNGTERFEQKSVRMHDLIRDMALKITETSPRFMVHAGEGLERVPFEDWSEDLERVSLIRNKIKILSFTAPPNCPRLTTLLLKDNPLSGIPCSFFTRMPCLTLLDLSNTRIKSLPNSISNLKSLNGLFLEHCIYLEYVPSLEELTALKELKLLRCSKIKDAPQGIEDLVHLRYLDLMRNTNLQTFPILKLSKLSHLQFLRIDYTKTTVATVDLLLLRHLKVVGACFKNVQEFLSYVKSEQFQNLEDYYLSVGIYTPRVHRPGFTTGKQVVFWSSSPFGSGVDTLVLPNNIKLLCIDECDCRVLKSLSDIPSLRDATDLIRCYLYRCGGLESIISCSLSEDCRIPLKSVEKLKLEDLPNLRVVFDGGVIPPQSISFNLKELILKKCPRIKNVFPVAKLLQNFKKLEELRVSECDDVEDIIGGGEEEVTEMSDSGGHHRQNDSNSIIQLPNLQRLVLVGLPKLKSMYKGKMLCKSLESIDVMDCPTLRRLPNFSVHVDSEQASSSAPPPPPPRALRRISGRRGWWKSLIWDDPQYKSTLEPLFRPRE